MQGVVALLPMAPFYGLRQPAAQDKVCLRTVHDTVVQAYAIAAEAASLLHWAHAVWGKPQAVAGVSFGGAMAALTSRLYPGRLAVVPYMGCDGPGEAFAKGAHACSPCICAEVAAGLRRCPCVVDAGPCSLGSLCSW